MVSHDTLLVAVRVQVLAEALTVTLPVPPVVPNEALVGESE